LKEEIKKQQQEIIQEFSELADWFEKYEYLIKLGKTLGPMDEKYKKDENLIGGCQSNVWIISEFIDDKIQYCADSDSLIVKGLISLILRVLNNQRPEEIIHTELFFINKIGLDSSLSPSRINGMMSIIKKIKELAEKNI